MNRHIKNISFFLLCLFWSLAAIWYWFNPDFKLENSDSRGAKENVFSSACAPREKPDSDAIRVCSWNVRNYAVAHRGGNAGVRPKPLSEKRELCREIARINPDVLLIQEIGEERFLAEFAKLLSEEGQFFKWRVAPNSKMNSRLGILSKIKIDGVFDTPDLSFFLGDKKCYSPRSVFGVRFRTSGVEWYAYTLHLKSKFGAKKADRDFFDYRYGEMGVILDTVSAQIGRGASACIAGDFNEEPREKAVELFASKNFILLQSDSAYSYYWAKKNLRQRYDYFYLTRPMYKYLCDGMAKVSVESSITASDHMPVYVDFKFSKQNTAGN